MCTRVRKGDRTLKERIYGVYVVTIVVQGKTPSTRHQSLISNLKCWIVMETNTACLEEIV